MQDKTSLIQVIAILA